MIFSHSVVPRETARDSRRYSVIAPRDTAQDGSVVTETRRTVKERQIGASWTAVVLATLQEGVNNYVGTVKSLQIRPRLAF